MKVKLQYIAEFQADIPASSEEEAKRILKEQIDGLIKKKMKMDEKSFTFCCTYSYTLHNIDNFIQKYK